MKGMKPMKKITRLFMIFTFILITLCIPLQTNAATNVKLNATKKTMYLKSTYQLKVTGTTKKITWKSSNPKVATVNTKGLVKAKAKGKVTITATIGSGSNSTKLKCNITVKGRLFSNVKNNTIDCPLNEYQEIAITFFNRKADEYLIGYSATNSIDFEFGKSDGKTTTLYIYPVKPGVATLTIYITKEIADEYNDKDYYEPLTLTINVGVGGTEFISMEQLEATYDVDVLDTFTTIHISYNASSLTGFCKSFDIEKDSDIELNKVYSYDGLRYKYTDEETVLFHLEDLKELNIIT